MHASVVAHPNIALVKYWGKRDSRLNLPAAGSLSLTLGPVATRTSLTFGAGGVLGSLGSGWSWDWMGPAMTYTAASLCCLIGFVLVVWKLRQPARAGPAA